MIIQFVLYLFIGALAGFLSGLLGIGGGIVVVPALAYMFTEIQLAPGLGMHLAAGTSLCAMIITTLFSLWSHAHSIEEVWGLIRRMLYGAILGAFIGALLADYLNNDLLKFIFSFLVLFVAINILFGMQWHASEDYTPKVWQSQLFTLFIGVMSGLLGIGGSTMLIPYLYYLNYDVRKIITLSTALGFFISIVGTFAVILFGWKHPGLPAWSTGYVYWPAALGIMLVSPFFAVMGAWCSKHLEVKILRQLFGMFLIFVAFDMLGTSFFH